MLKELDMESLLPEFDTARQYPTGKIVNIDLLKEELSVALGSGYVNAYIDKDGDVMTVMMNNPASDVDVIIADAVAHHDPAGRTTFQQAEEQRAIDFSELKTSVEVVLSDVASGLTQIDNDLISLNAATTLAQVKPLMANVLNRQRRIIQSLVYAVKVVRWIVT